MSRASRRARSARARARERRACTPLPSHLRTFLQLAVRGGLAEARVGRPSGDRLVARGSGSLGAAEAIAADGELSAGLRQPRPHLPLPRRARRPVSRLRGRHLRGRRRGARRARLALCARGRARRHRRPPCPRRPQHCRPRAPHRCRRAARSSGGSARSRAPPGSAGQPTTARVARRVARQQQAPRTARPLPHPPPTPPTHTPGSRSRTLRTLPTARARPPLPHWPARGRAPRAPAPPHVRARRRRPARRHHARSATEFPVAISMRVSPANHHQRKLQFTQFHSVLSAATCKARVQNGDLPWAMYILIIDYDWGAGVLLALQIFPARISRPDFSMFGVGGPRAPARTRSDLRRGPSCPDLRMYPKSSMGVPRPRFGNP